MNLKFATYLTVVFAITKTSISESLADCRPVDETSFPVCTRYNFVSTNAYLANDFYGYSKIMKNIRANLGNCSKYTNFILCSLYVPRCQENMAKPVLPCRDVCQEFVRDCSGKMDMTGLNWLKALCSLLGTRNETDPTCFKPTDFKPAAPQVLYCNKTVFSEMCDEEFKELKGALTIIPSNTQDLSEFRQTLNATVNTLVNNVKSPRCQEILRKLACASYTPPCEGNNNLALCKFKCDVLRADCPEAQNISEVSSYCAEPAQGKTDSGFCKLTRWPSASHWDKDTSYQTLPRPPFPGGLIAILVLVPLTAVVFIYVAVAIRRRYEQKKSGYLQQRSTYTDPEENLAL